MNRRLPSINYTKIAKAGLISLCLFLLAFSNNKFDGEGKAIISPSQITPLGKGEITIRYLVGEHGINVGGGIQTAFPRRWKSQNKKPLKHGFIKASLSRKKSGYKLTITNKDRSLDDVARKHLYVITITITKKPLVAGDTISVTFLKKNYNKTPAFTQNIAVASDGDGDGNFTVIKDFPKFSIRSGTPKKIFAIAPTDLQVGKKFNLKIAVLDSSYNAVTDYSGTIEFTSSDKQAKLPGPYTFSIEDGGTKKFSLIINTPGYHTVSVSEKNGDLKVVSNPLDCKDSAPPKKIWWGDLHSHTEISLDGMGNGSFKYARDVACLDFYSLTDHFNNINAKNWDFTKQETIRFHRPNEFVTILAYETSMFTLSGHHNVYFNCSNGIIPQIPLSKGSSEHLMRLKAY